MKNKISKTFSISEETYEKFMEIIEKENLNKSKLIEKWIINFIDNYDIAIKKEN
jgi:hypothetical protein